MSFIPKDFLKSAVKEKNIRKIRVALSTYITKDPGNSDGEIEHVIKYIESNFGSIWENHDNKKEEPRSKWNIDYIGLLQSDLMMNFSKKRVNHILEVGRALYPKNEIKTIKRKTKDGMHYGNSKNEGNYLGKWIVAGVGVIAVGVMATAAVKICSVFRK